MQSDIRVYKNNLFGVDVSAITRKETRDFIIEAAEKKLSFTVDFMPVHGLMVASKDNIFNEYISTFDIVAPDGQPVRWALNHFHKANLTERVYGPDLTLDVCEVAEEKGLSVYFYGSTSEVLEALEKNLLERFPNLKIAGLESPPFRELTKKEDREVIERINSSGADICFIGLGCPKQEVFAATHKGKIIIPMLCVGAAFDFHAGLLDQAPQWMSERGLEWLFRLYKEPKRLFKRYFYYNSKFICALIKNILKNKFD